MEDTIIDEYKKIIDSKKFVEEGKNSANLRDFQNSQKIVHHIKNVYELWKAGDTNPIHMTIGFTNYCQHKGIRNKDTWDKDTRHKDTQQRDLA